jgi:hypothetical protein
MYAPDDSVTSDWEDIRDDPATSDDLTAGFL